MTAPAVLSILSLTDFVPDARLIVVAGIAAAAGTALAVGADRLLPWDALGVLAIAAGLVLGSPYVLHRDSGSGMGVLATYLLVGGTAFALAAGATRYWRSTVDGLAVNTALGFGLMMLAATALIPPVTVEWTTDANWGRLSPIAVPALSLACALGLALLFVVGRGRPSAGFPASMGNTHRPKAFSGQGAAG